MDLQSDQVSTNAKERETPKQEASAPAAPAVEGYVLKRDYRASSRFVFDLDNSALQFNLHPDIPAPKGNERIADVATGTGIWLVDLAHSLSSTVQLDGFDISLTQAPASEYLPSNVNLQKGDIFTDPPSKIVSKFDIVHVRLITLVIKDNNVLSIVKNLCKLLKPGGFFQWDEVDTVGSYIDSVDSSVSTTALQSLFKSFAIPKSARGRDDWKTSLSTTLNQNGFQDSKLYTYKCNMSMAGYWHDMYMQSWEEFAMQIFESTQNAYKTINQAELEAQNGAAVIFPKFVWVAKAA